jgi:hypothetical protein
MPEGCGVPDVEAVNGILAMARKRTFRTQSRKGFARSDARL